MAYNKESGMYKGFIYCIENKINGKKYIGQTSQTIKSRYKQHLYDSNILDYALYRAIRKYGKDKFLNYEIENFEEIDRKTLHYKLDEREIYWITYYDSYHNGYNETIGGNNAPNKFPERKIIEYSINGNELYRYNSISDAASCNNINHSDITSCCMKTKINRVGNKIYRYEEDPLTNYEIEKLKIMYPKIYQYDLIGNLINTYEFIQDAENNFDGKIFNSNIGACCSGVVKSAGGYVWRKYPDVFDSYEIPVISRKIEQRNKYTGEIIYVFNNFKEISDKLNIKNVSSISNCCNNITATAYGYHWCYENNFGNNELKRVQEKMVSQYSLDGNLIKTYNRITDACIELKLTSKSCVSTIGAVCNGKKKTAYGYIWRFYNDEFDIYNMDIKHNNNCKKVYCYDKSGGFIKIYPSAKEASVELKINITMIHKHCRGECSSVRCKYILSYNKMNINDIQDRLINKHCKKVNLYDNNIEYLNTYDSILEISKELNISSPYASQCCSEHRKINSMYLYYADDETQPDKTKIIKAS